MNEFPSRRHAAEAQLNDFIPKCGDHYRKNRNYDRGREQHKSVSCLSPAVRHRLILEQELVAKVLRECKLSQAEKFVQEVFWRTYWKGWLELRPQVWQQYLQDLDGIVSRRNYVENLQKALASETGIDCFDYWVKELIETGYLHNHARMWFASIWIFTLKLPWQLGADFFLRHLLDGDPASNTLSWRWVAGLHTKGKTYLARSSNIEKYTQGRFKPGGLATSAAPLSESLDLSIGELSSLPHSPASGQRYDVLLHEDDLCPEIGGLSEVIKNSCDRIAILEDFSERRMSTLVSEYKKKAIKDCRTRLSEKFGKNTILLHSLDALKKWDTESPNTVVFYKPACGFLNGIAKRFRSACELRREWDSMLFPAAKGGFFQFKKMIPNAIRKLISEED